MKNESTTLKIALCGPGDVSKEIQIAKEVIDEWNQTNWEATGLGLIARHWQTNSVPDMADRGQRVIDRQLIDESDLVIGIFWSRLGTPTGLAESGTAEEIDRAIHRDIRTMVYFSELEAPNQRIDVKEVSRLEEFRQRVFRTGLASTFSSRRQFEKDFRKHLGLAVHKILSTRSKADESCPPRENISQSGSNNTQIVGNGNSVRVTAPKTPKIVVEQSPGQITAPEQKRIAEWVAELAILTSNTTGKSTGAAMREYWSRLHNKFDVPRYNALESTQMGEVEDWFNISKARLLRSPKAKKSGASGASWKRAIKTKMKAMGRTNEDYYPEIAVRLKIPPFTSLTKLSAKRLEKVYNLVTRDSKKPR